MILLLAAAAFSFQASMAIAAEPEATEYSEQKSIIEGMRVQQIGSTQVILEIRGTKLTMPAQQLSGNAASLVWSAIRFPRNTDKKDWWDEMEWKVFRFNVKTSEQWLQKFDLPLVEQINVVSNDKNGVTMNIIGPKKLTLKNISGMAGSDKQRLTFETPADITPPPLMPQNRARAAGDPLSITAPVTLELREVSLREVLRMLAELRNLNLVLDASVPETPMTFSFKKTPFAEVFSYMLRMNDLGYSMAGKTLVVGTPESIGKALGKNITKQYKIAYAEPAKLSPIIMGLVTLQKPPVVDERLRSLYITATPEQHTVIGTLINRVDHPGKQIMIEARLVEINDGAAQSIETVINSVYHGWIFTYGKTGLGSRYTYGNNKVPSNVNPTGTTTQGELPLIGDATNTVAANVVDPLVKMLDAGLQALESDNKGKVLASPSVVALDGQKASVKLTHNYLYQSGVDDNGNPEFTNQETGPTLEFTPMLGRDGFITIKMKISTGEIVAFRQSGDSEAPETTKREVETQIRVRDGELFVIGGLYQENKTKEVSRIPILGNIPLLGELFTNRSTKHTKSQVAFIAIPYILDIPTGEAEILGMPTATLFQ